MRSLAGGEQSAMQPPATLHLAKRPPPPSGVGTMPPSAAASGVPPASAEPEDEPDEEPDDEPESLDTPPSNAFALFFAESAHAASPERPASTAAPANSV